MAYKDLAGQRYGRLTVIRRAPNDAHGNILWYCECDCGGNATTRSNALRSAIRRGHDPEAYIKNRLKELEGQP